MSGLSEHLQEARVKKAGSAAVDVVRTVGLDCVRE